MIYIASDSGGSGEVSTYNIFTEVFSDYDDDFLSLVYGTNVYGVAGCIYLNEGTLRHRRRCFVNEGILRLR